MWNFLKTFGLWTTILRWHEPRFYRVRLKGDLPIRLAIAFGAGCVGTAALLVLFGVNVNPPAATFSLVGMLIVGGLTASILLGGGGNSGGSVRVCEEGIVCTRMRASFPHLKMEELSWPYRAVGQATLIPGEHIGKSFSLMFVSSPDGLEMLGVPSRIELQELASILAGRGVRVRETAAVPPQFTESLGWSAGIGSLALGLPIVLGSLIFYAVNAPAGRENAVVQAQQPLVRRFAPPRPPVNARASAFPRPPIHIERPRPKVAGATPPPPVAEDASLADIRGPGADNVASVSQPPTGEADAGGPFGRGRIGPPMRGPPRMGPRFGPPFAGGPRAPRGPGFAGKAEPVSDERVAELKSAVAAAKSAATKTAKAPKKSEPAVVKSGPIPGGKTRTLGGDGGWDYMAVHRDRKPVVGLRWSMGRWGREQAIRRLEPIFDRPEAPKSDVIAARDGYVLGGMYVVSGGLVNAARVIFVRQQEDGSLDKRDFYLSEWIGEPGDKTPEVLGDGVVPVIGIYGRHGSVVNTVGLVIDKQ